ncbi:MAG: biotin carboxylase N-terminal domain-containing protein [PVC group bacterium]
MIESLLVANRGEIAVRIIRACRDLGARAVAVYSEADRHALHVRLADRAICIGPARARDSYLKGENIVTAAIHADCDAVHPGVGFLSEDPGFARLVEASGLKWIGPAPGVIELLGDKLAARKTARNLGIPVIPGAEIDTGDPASVRKTAEALGYPVILKAAGGGGGKGMRIVRAETELESLLALAAREARSAFANGSLYLEKYFEDPRHVEIQVISLPGGAGRLLGERDCTVQFNHQKLIEETPSPGLAGKLRQAMEKAALALFEGLGYAGLGTVEFLVARGKYYFMEVNARLQVEHSVTEMLTGIDLVRQQIIACTENRLDLDDDFRIPPGYALECRINAAAPGRVREFIPPGGFGVRVDTHLFAGLEITPYYDALVAKVIVGARDRAEGIRRMRRALGEFLLEGIPTNLELQKAVIAHRRFARGDFGTTTFDSCLEEEKP